MIELRISGFERFEACAPADSNANPCCKVRGALKSEHHDRSNNTVRYSCRTCGAKHSRTFADLTGLLS